jgi:hypothetical protein
MFKNPQLQSTSDFGSRRQAGKGAGIHPGKDVPGHGFEGKRVRLEFLYIAAKIQPDPLFPVAQISRCGCSSPGRLARDTGADGPLPVAILFPTALETADCR